MYLLIGAIVVIAAVGLIAGISDGEKNRTRSAARQSGGGALPAARNTPRPQPPGPTPPGKVWSAEHGHWHDVNPAGSSPIQVQTSKAPITATPAQPSAPVPQPPGTPPPGKVWSPEHGHWHDAPK